MKTERPKISASAYFVADLLTITIEVFIYFSSFVLPGYVIFMSKGIPFALLLLMGILGWLFAGFVFVLFVVAFKRFVIGEVNPGRFFLTSSRAYRWIATDKLVKIMNRSPFRVLVNDLTFYRYLYLRGMGAHVTVTLMLGQRVVIPEPYLLFAGEEVLIGDEAVISGHKVEHNVVTLESVQIGNNVIIGARAVILPGVKIGNGAIIGANALITRGTVIGPGETWSGNPARKIEIFAGKSTVDKNLNSSDRSSAGVESGT